MTGKQNKMIERENGAVQIVEASFVFPIMFIILFFLIYMGNAFYMKAQIESVVAQKAVQGAAYCADPLLETIKVLETIKATNTIPSISQLDADPYRYIIGGMDEVEKKIGKEVKETIEASSASFFRNMGPVVKTHETKIAKFNNYVLYSTFSVDVECKIEFPIKFLGRSTPSMLVINSHSEVAVNDTAEFIRNTDMFIDYFADSKFGQTIKGVFDKINDFLNTFASK